MSAETKPAAAPAPSAAPGAAPAKASPAARAPAAPPLPQRATQQQPPAPQGGAPPPGQGDQKPAEAPDWVRFRQEEARLERQRREIEAARRQADEHGKSIASQREALALLERAKGGDVAAMLELEKAGYLKYDALTTAKLGKKPDAAEALKRDLEEVRGELKALREAREQESQQRELARGMDEVKRVVVEAGDRFAMVGDLLDHEPELVRDTLREMSQRAPDMPLAEMLDRWEQYERQKHERRAARLAPHAPAGQDSHVQTDATAPAKAGASKPRDQNGSRKPPAKGLTSDIASERGGAPARRSRADRDREKADRFERAVRAARGG